MNTDQPILCGRGYAQITVVARGRGHRGSPFRHPAPLHVGLRRTTIARRTTPGPPRGGGLLGCGAVLRGRSVVLAGRQRRGRLQDVLSERPLAGQQLPGEVVALAMSSCGPGILPVNGMFSSGLPRLPDLLPGDRDVPDAGRMGLDDKVLCMAATDPRIAQLGDIEEVPGVRPAGDRPLL
jgi:hypothetical protein